MSDDILVRVENVSKKFCRDLKRSLWYGVKDIASELFGQAGNSDSLRKGEFWAVKNVSFELRRGECLGLIGHNGAGKSTLLKMLNGLIKPDQGTITMKGRVGALIELGAGFNPILTGRENIYVNGQILGLSKKEIDAKFDAIVEFADIRDFIDMPVQNYSSGMKVRLGFSVAAQLEPDVLIIDEVLAVGDVGFRAKCFNQLAKISSKSAVVLVSHSMPQVARLSNKLMLMASGSVKYSGNQIAEGIEQYFNEFETEQANIVNTGASLKDLKIHNDINESGRHEISYKNDLRLSFEAYLSRPVDNLEIVVIINDQELKQIGLCSKYVDPIIEGSKYLVKVTIQNILLTTGLYTITLIVRTYENQKRIVLGRYANCLTFFVKGSPTIDHAPLVLEGDWILEPEFATK